MNPREIAVTNLHLTTIAHHKTRIAWETAIVAARDTGISVRTIAGIVGVSPQTVLNICARVTASGG